MASTNKTTNYELSQFLGSDKPAWLSDYNTDMSKIDTQMKLNADAATAASGSASTANTNIGTLSELTTDVKTSAVAAINEVDSHADVAQSTANAANTTANTAATNVAKFNLTNRYTLTPSVNLGSLGPLTNIQFAADSSNSVFKVYGRVQINNLTGISGNLTLTLGTTSLRPSADYEINTGALLVTTNTSGIVNAVGSRNIKVHTTGEITIESPSTNNILSVLDGTSSAINVYLSPCLYFNTDFGDE